jgi:hypothetical protein
MAHAMTAVDRQVWGLKRTVPIERGRKYCGPSRHQVR